jgi:hypothetical protein
LCGVTEGLCRGGIGSKLLIPGSFVGFSSRIAKKFPFLEKSRMCCANEGIGRIQGLQPFYRFGAKCIASWAPDLRVTVARLEAILDRWEKQTRDN